MHTHISLDKHRAMKCLFFLRYSSFNPVPLPSPTLQGMAPSSHGGTQTLKEANTWLFEVWVLATHLEELMKSRAPQMPDQTRSILMESRWRERSVGEELWVLQRGPRIAHPSPLPLPPPPCFVPGGGCAGTTPERQRDVWDSMSGEDRSLLLSRAWGGQGP